MASLDLAAIGRLQNAYGVLLHKNGVSLRIRSAAACICSGLLSYPGPPGAG